MDSTTHKTPVQLEQYIIIHVTKRHSILSSESSYVQRVNDSDDLHNVPVSFSPSVAPVYVSQSVTPCSVCLSLSGHSVSEITSGTTVGTSKGIPSRLTTQISFVRTQGPSVQQVQTHPPHLVHPTQIDRVSLHRQSSTHKSLLQTYLCNSLILLRLSTFDTVPTDSEQRPYSFRLNISFIYDSVVF